MMSPEKRGYGPKGYSLEDIVDLAEASSTLGSWSNETVCDLANHIKELRAERPTSEELASVKAERDTAAARDVLSERRRQVEVEGWTADRDDAEHADGELARAAACYCAIGGNPEETRQARLDSGWTPATWPWDWSWWKPTDRRRDLVKAGALILAEIERLDRAALRPGSTGEGK